MRYAKMAVLSTLFLLISASARPASAWHWQLGSRFSLINHVQREIGYGWGDGYHARGSHWNRRPVSAHSASGNRLYAPYPVMVRPAPAHRPVTVPGSPAIMAPTPAPQQTHPVKTGRRPLPSQLVEPYSLEK